tara:strand:- start:10079 stop:10603 length:525 start_codon:yes stop_codon:yes gene_type:complete
MKLVNIILEKKNNWLPMSPDEVKQAEKDLFDLIDTAYGPIGGHPNVTSPASISSAADLYTVIDLDDDPEDDAVIMSKNRAGGKKFVGMGHDNTKQSRSAAVNYTADNLKKKGHYIEVSGKIYDILKAKGVPVVDDEETVRNALKGKEIVWHGDGTYDRVIGGKKIKKIMMGKPN